MHLLRGWTLVVAAIVASGAPRGARAQRATADASDDAMCLGFAFGAWSPRLDWRAAGHGDRPDSSRLVHAPDGRDWASDATSPRDTVLILYPSWWPVGVEVTIPSTRLTVGDTVRGRAIALVADGRVRPPMATVRAWRVACGTPGAQPHADRAAPVRPAPDDSVAARAKRPPRPHPAA